MHALLGVVGEFLLIGWAFTAVTAPLRCIISDEYRTRRFKQKNYASQKRFYAGLAIEFVFGSLYFLFIGAVAYIIIHVL